MTPLELVEKAVIDSGYIKVKDSADVDTENMNYAITTEPDGEYVYLWFNDECLQFRKDTQKLC